MSTNPGAKLREFTIYECPKCHRITTAVRCIHKLLHPGEERGYATVPLKVVEKRH
jgi:hypothetical protein